MIDIDALKRDKRPQSSTIVHALIDRLEAAEKERDALRADKAILQQMMYSLKDRLEAAEADALEQSRLNGMGGEREAALMTKIDRLRRALMAMTNGYKSAPYAQWSPEMHFAAEVLEESK